MGKIAHFGGDHGEAATLFTGACGFHRGIQGQQVGLEGDVIDDADDGGDLLAGVRDLLHGGDGIFHYTATVYRLVQRDTSELAGLAGVVCVLAYRGSDFFHAGSSLFQVGCLHFGASCKIHVAFCDFLGGILYGIGAVTDAADNAREVGYGGIDIVFQAGEGTFIVSVDGSVEFAPGQGTEYAGCIVDDLFQYLHQVVHAATEAAEEAFLAFQADAFGEIAHQGVVHDALDFTLHSDFAGAVEPFHYGTQTFTLFVDDGIGSEPQ